MPQLEHVRSRRDLGDRGDARVVPLLTVGALHQRIDPLSRQVDAEPLEDRGGTLPVGQAGEAQGLLEVEGRQRLGNVEATAGRDSLHDYVGEEGTRAVVAARVHVG